MNTNLEKRLEKLEQTNNRPNDLNWLCIAPLDESLVDGVQVFKAIEDIPESYQRDYPGIKVYLGVCPNDWRI